MILVARLGLDEGVGVWHLAAREYGEGLIQCLSDYFLLPQPRNTFLRLPSFTD